MRLGGSGAVSARGGRMEEEKEEEEEDVEEGVDSLSDQMEPQKLTLPIGKKRVTMQQDQCGN